MPLDLPEEAGVGVGVRVSGIGKAKYRYADYAHCFATGVNSAGWYFSLALSFSEPGRSLPIGAKTARPRVHDGGSVARGEIWQKSRKLFGKARRAGAFLSGHPLLLPPTIGSGIAEKGADRGRNFAIFFAFGVLCSLGLSATSGISSSSRGGETIRLTSTSTSWGDRRYRRIEWSRRFARPQISIRR